VNIHLAQTERGKYVKKPIFEKGAVNIQQFLERLEIDDYKGYLYQELEGDIVPPLHKGTRGGGRGMKILDVALQDALRELSGQFRYFTELFSQGGAKEVTDAYLKKFRAEFINRGKLERLVRYSEASEISKVEKIGQEIDALPGRNLVLIAGPSAAGKTPTARRLLNAVKKGKVVTLNLDNYYRDHEDIRRTNGGKLDFDFPEALDLALINEHITALLKGEAVQVPKFDMDKGVRKPGDTTTLQLGQDQVLVIEGVFALHPAISKGLQPAMRLFIKGFPLKLQSGETLSYDDYRLIRRIVRDARTRGISALRTINQWPMVLRGEETHIFPTAANARLLVEPYFPYELPTLKFLIMPMLDEAEKLAGEDPEGNREALSKIAWLRRLLLQVPPVNVNDTPVDADFMEFVGPIDNRAIEKMLGKYSGDKLYSSPGIFIGMPFDPDILESLAKVRNDLKQFNRILELQEPEEMHITVAAKTSSFYDGPADETALKEAESAASDSAARNNAFHASLKGKLQLKPDGAVILEITDERMLQGVRALRDTVAPAWYKPAIVHITLGRLKTLDYDLKDIRAIEQVLEKHNEAGTLNKRITVKSLQYGQHKLKEKATVADAALLKRINLVSDEASDLLGALVMELPVVFDMMNPLNPADIYNPVSQFIPQVATPQTEQRLKDIAHREKIAGKFLPVIAADADIAGVSQYAALGIDAFAVAWGDGGEFLFNLEVPLPGEKEPVKVRVLADNRQLAAGNIAHVLNLQPEGAAALSAERRALILGRGSLALLDKLDRISRIKKDDKTIVKLRELGYDIRGRFELGAVELQGASASLAIPGLVKDAYAEQRLFQTVPFIYKADAKPALFNTGELLPLLYEKFTAASGEGAAVDMNLLGVLAADEAIGIDGFESSYPALSGIVLPRDSGEDTTEEAARYTIETAVIPAIMRRGNGAGSENTVFAEIVPVSALRGKAGAFAAQLRKMGFDAGAVTQVLREDRADPGIGKITDLETYMFRNGITDAQLMPLVQPVADSPFAAFSPMAGDEQLIDWLKVSERFKFKGLTLADVVAPRRTDTVDRNEVNVREFALARKLRLTPRQADEFEAYAAKNAYWLDRYAAARVLGKPVAGVSAAEIEEVRSQRDFDAYRRLQWILSDQLEKALAVIRLRGDHVFFWLDVNKDNYRNLLNAVTEKEGVPVVYPGILAHWFGFGFDGVRLNVKDASILTEEYVQELKNAIKAANPGAFAAKAVFVKLPKGVAPSVVSLLRSEGFSLVENFLERDTLAGTASVDIDSPDDTVRPHRNPAFRQKYGEPGDREFYRRIVADAENLRAPRVFAMLFTYRGDSIPVKTVDPGAQEHFTYRIPREGDVERSRFSIGELLADITGKAGLAIPEKYYDEGYRSGLSYADVPEDLPAKEIYELLSDITETYMHDKQAWLRNSGGNYFDKANRVFSSSHSSWGMRRYIGNLEKFVRLESLSDGDKANYTLQLAGFLRGIVEQAAERHQGKGTRELLSASPDHTVLRSLGSLASVFGTADSRDKQGLPREVEEYLRSSTLPLFETVTAGSGDEAKILSHILAAQRERALSPAETVLLARLLIKRGATPDEVRAAINPLASEIVQYGVFSGMAGNKPAVNAWIISELLGIYNVITDLDAGHLGDTLDDMMKVFNDMAVRSLTSAA
jgi:uridine kinase/2'-5' RNA ligase